MIIDTYMIEGLKRKNQAYLKHDQDTYDLYKLHTNNLLKLRCRQFLLSLTSNEPFYSDLFRQYNDQSVHLNIDEICENELDCLDILTDYTEYGHYI